MHKDLQWVAGLSPPWMERERSRDAEFGDDGREVGIRGQVTEVERRAAQLDRAGRGSEAGPAEEGGGVEEGRDLLAIRAYTERAEVDSAVLADLGILLADWAASRLLNHSFGGSNLKIIGGSTRALVLTALSCMTLMACMLRKDTSRSVPDATYATMSGAWPSQQVPAGELIGVVLDAGTGDGIPAARVWLTPGDASVTDSLGRFRLRKVKPGPDTLRAVRIGYALTQLPMEFALSTGYAAVLVARVAPVVLCGSLTEVPHAVVVRVRDIRTAAAPEAPATLVARDGTYADSATADTRPSGEMYIRAAQGRIGRYAVHLRAPGYLPWFGQGEAKWDEGSCGAQFRGAYFNAWLVPQ